MGDLVPDLLCKQSRVDFAFHLDAVVEADNTPRSFQNRGCAYSETLSFAYKIKLCLIYYLDFTKQFFRLV
jgi:hypothetical protein